MEAAGAAGMKASLSGRGAVRQTSTRQRLLAHFGVEFVLRDALLAEDGEEHTNNVLQEVRDEWGYGSVSGM